MDAEGKIKEIVLKRMHRCVVCHHDYDADNINVLSRDHDMWTMVVECPDCHSRSFVAAVLSDDDSTDAQLALRRLANEAMSQGSSPVRPEADEQTPTHEVVDALDVIEMHQFLDEFDGDFKRLFRKV